MKPHLDIPPDADVSTPEFIALLNDRLRRMGDFVSGESRRLAARFAGAESPVPVPPGAPTGVVVTIGGTDTDFTIGLEWTAPVPADNVTGYEREVKYFDDEDLTIEASGWIPLGNTMVGEGTEIVSGPWPRPTHDQWVKGRVRAFDSRNRVSPWAESAAADKVDLIVTVTAPPVAPASPTIAEDDLGAVSFGFTLGWTPDASPGGTMAYEWQVKYWNDSGLSMAASDWMYLTVATGAATAAAKAGPWPRPAVPQWAKGRVRAINGLGDVTAWVETSGTAAITATAGAAPPAQPGASDWSTTVAAYGRRDQTGENIARVEATATTLAAGVAYVSIYAARDTGSGAPSDPAAYKDIGVNEPAASSGSTVAKWNVVREDASVTWWLVLTASSETYHSVPTSAHTAIAKSVTVNAVSLPSPPTGFSVSIINETRNGSPGGRLKYTLTKPADPEYFTSEFWRIKTDSGGIGLPGEVFKYVGSGVETVEAPDWWPLPPTTEYYIFEARAVSRAFDANGVRVSRVSDPSEPRHFLTVPASTGLDLAAATTTSVQGILSNVSNYPSDKRPIIVLSGFLPTLPDGGYPIGSLVFRTDDGKVYRNVANAWTKGVDPQDLIVGTIASGVAFTGLLQVAAGAVTVYVNPADSTNPVKVVNSTFSRFASSNGLAWRVESNTDSTAFSSLSLTSCTVNAGGGSLARGTLGSALLQLVTPGGTIGVAIDVNSTYTASAANAGAASLPSNPVGFLIVEIAGTLRKIPYYAT